MRDQTLDVLLVEDNAGDARLIEQHLGRVSNAELPAPLAITHVESRTEAMERLEHERFDVMLLDLGLPESHGVDTVEHVIGEQPDVPIIVLTGLQNRDVAVEAIRMGAQDYLSKEVHIDGPMLARAIRYAIERHNRERQLELRTRRLEDFAKVISHELRNPLNIVDGYAALLREREGDLAAGTKATRALDRMNVLVEKLSQLPRLLGEGVDTVSVAEIAAASWDDLDTDDATLELKSGLPEVLADPGQLHVLFVELFQNAVENGDGAVTVTVGASRDGSPEQGFYVADDGPGLADSGYERLFEQNYSTGGDHPRFGLTLVRSVAEDHGWTVRARESAEGGLRVEICGVSNTPTALHEPSGTL